MASEVEKEIYECLDNSRNFVVDAGAGSGKTWSLVQALVYLTQKIRTDLIKNRRKVLCITYTKVARDEIIKRIEYSELVNVTTIHDFLWWSISQFQAELKSALLYLIKNKLEKVEGEISTTKNKATKKYADLIEKQTKYADEISAINKNGKPIRYGQYPFFKDNVISHDEVIVLSEFIFSNYPKINKIVTDSYPFIFIDEYQDTHVPVVSILISHLSKQKLVLGFFGDKMQKIYDTGVGDITATGDFKLIQKKENYRSSKTVVSLLNKIREDLQQTSAAQKVSDGTAKFYYSNQKIDLEAMAQSRYGLKKGDFKILYLTHNLISKENGYSELYEIYNSQRKADYLTKNEENRGRCPYADLLFDIEEIVELYESNRVQLLLKKVAFEVTSFESKIELNVALASLCKIRGQVTINKVVDFVFSEKILEKTQKLEKYDFTNEEKKELYEKLMITPYQQFINLYNVQNSNTPFSTKHSTKGEEFDNVIVVIDDQAWNHYNFEKYFANDRSNNNIYERTRNLFYVVCSRAKINLAICFHGDPNTQALTTINNWFGSSNVHRL
jgi:DNA helicase-2/ATP-dependent DNA helicase PcrA